MLEVGKERGDVVSGEKKEVRYCQKKRRNEFSPSGSKVRRENINSSSAGK